ncbi:hypothetical protein GCM10023195_32590 [Actinoallomurus liliacearum]|uniref:Secreted protein n=1 Tax=Actinoallomurus liliacearum TaxID=1080073 RepID=A0ABP8TLQ0_9ACTN
MRFAVLGPAWWLEGSSRCHRPSDGDVSDVLGRVHIRVIGMPAGATVVQQRLLLSGRGREPEPHARTLTTTTDSPRGERRSFPGLKARVAMPYNR